MRETFAYLRDVLGIKYLPISLEAIERIQPPARPLGQPEVNTPVPRPTAELPQSTPTNLSELETHLQGCTRCKLHKGRRNIVFGAGNPKADLMFVGEAPSEEEDLQGTFLQGPSGQLLSKMIGAMGLTQEQVYITSVVKCRPPMNRSPEADEVMECSGFLKSQIKFVNPKLIVALGTFAAQSLLHTDERISKLRGKIIDLESRKVIATFHPSYLLRNPSEKKSAWEDLKLAMDFLGLKV